MRPAGAAQFIRANLALRPLPGLPAIQLHHAHSGSGLSRLTGSAAPYWAFPWPGGMALALFLQQNPEVVAGKNVLDFGCGGGLAGIAAAQAGALSVTAADTDPLALVAAALNAEANGVALSLHAQLPHEALDSIELVLAGDVFYSPAVARRTVAFLQDVRARGLDVLVGDPGRADLPRPHLSERARFPVREFGGAPVDGIVYAFEG